MDAGQIHVTFVIQRWNEDAGIARPEKTSCGGKGQEFCVGKIGEYSTFAIREHKHRSNDNMRAEEPRRVKCLSWLVICWTCITVEHVATENTFSKDHLSKSDAGQCADILY